MNAPDLNEKVNFLDPMIKQWRRSLPLKYALIDLLIGFFVYYVWKLWCTLRKSEATTRNDRFTISTLENYECFPEKPIGKESSSPITQVLMDLKATKIEIYLLKEENVSLKEYLARSQAQVDALKTNMVKMQTTNF